MRNIGLYIATWTLFCSCSAVPDIHLQMSPSQLNEVFHVNEHNSVPNYEVVKLIHHSSHHSIRKRSIDNKSNSKINNNLIVEEHHLKHVKKDLSKTKFNNDEVNSNNTNSVDVNISNNNSDSSKKFSDVKISDIKEHKVSLEAFGKTLNLTLKQTSGLFKDGPHTLRMWNVRTDPKSQEDLLYEEIPQEQEEDSFGNVYQDQTNMAAILMRKHLESGDLMMEGSIGHELVIKPVPLEVSKAADGDIQHVVYKRQTPEENDQNSDYAYMEPDRLLKRYRRKRSVYGANITDSHSRSKRSSPHIIYPEILVIVDYDGYRLHGGDNVQVKRYFVSFWNGVDLRYRLLKGPRIRISIAGIIISRGRDATPYLERNRVGRDAIDSAAALTDMGKYLFRERRLPVYDIAVAITKLDMCRRQYANDACNRGTAGFAYVGGACVVNKRLEKVNSVAIIEDTGGFSGIIVAAHEVGHLLGAVHDGSPPPSYLGGPGAEKCRWEDGYIMSDLRHTERGFRWSPCSVQSFHHFLNGDTASCLHNAPHEDEALGRSLPGTLLTLDAQCRRDRGTSACFKDERVCAQLFCFDSASGYCVAYRPAAEGSTCGDGQHCLDGRCVAENENIIPDYSQHTPAYASPNAFNRQQFKYNYDDKESQQDEYIESTPSTSSTSTTTTSTTTTTTTTTEAPSSPSTSSEPTSARSYLYNYNQQKQSSSSTENPYRLNTDERKDKNPYKDFMNAIKRKRRLQQQIERQAKELELIDKDDNTSIINNAKRQKSIDSNSSHF